MGGNTATDGSTTVEVAANVSTEEEDAATSAGVTDGTTTKDSGGQYEHYDTTGHYKDYYTEERIDGKIQPDDREDSVEGQKADSPGSCRGLALYLVTELSFSEIHRSISLYPLAK